VRFSLLLARCALSFSAHTPSVDLPTAPLGLNGNAVLPTLSCRRAGRRELARYPFGCWLGQPMLPNEILQDAKDAVECSLIVALG
jgi:hypothetical protein